MHDGTHAPTPDGMTEVLRCLDRAFTAAGREALVSHGITAEQWRILLVLRDGDGHSMSELVERLGVAPATATRLVDALVATTFVYRRTDPRDRRRVLVYQNPLKSGDLDAVEASAWSVLSDAVGGLTEAGRQRLAELVARDAATDIP